MTTTDHFARRHVALFALIGISSLTGCVNAVDKVASIEPTDFGPAQECLARAMYFESNRSSRDGMMAVGTVVMNRVESGKYPSDVCQVVAQRGQFAPGVMTKPMAVGRELAMDAAHDVLSGERSEDVRRAMYFHTAGLKFPYSNMHYTTVAGGNAFYEKISRHQNEAFDVAVRSAAVPAPAARSSGRSVGDVDEVTTASITPSTSEKTKSPFLALWSNAASQPTNAQRALEPLVSSDGKSSSPVLERRMGDLPGVSADVVR